ncbi:glycosyltransferase family 2 protein [Seonamhaeicola sp. ML3]|uniref:glycosyltransferase family 2 protein n=1 Tax=Seonamhaeicola sp. ML3 TaxID=2937786 RepID=UPI00200DAD86|nr:glycosyltransferase family 2 protein [Seonamhaeicola sp. ML3]
MPFFSIIIPLFNKEKYIGSSLNSALSQTFQDFEVIIVDDGSTDNSLKIVKDIKDERIEIIKQKNKGAASARNLGIANSRGKYIALLDADDIWSEIHLNELHKQIKLHSSAALFCNNYQIRYVNDNVRNPNFNMELGQKPIIIDDYFKASTVNNIAWTSAVCFEKKKFDTLGGFNVKLEIAEDLDLWNRFALNYPVSFNPTITMTYNFQVEDSLSKKENNQIRYDFINSYTNLEKSNNSLKKYLDVNRYAVALRCKINRDRDLYKKLKGEINPKNLNFKQKLILNSPLWLIKLVKNFQKFLLKFGVYITAYK